MKDFFEEVLKDSKMEFNPALNELHHSLTTPIRLLKGYDLDDMVVKLNGNISLYGADDSFESFIASIKECVACIGATVDGKHKEVGLDMNSFGITTKKIDLIIAINAIGQSESYSNKYKELMLNFAINKVMIPVDDGFMNLKTDSIVYIESSGHHTKIFFNNGSMFTSLKSLGDLKDILPMDNFYRIHDAFLLNLNYVSFVNTKTKKVDIEPPITEDRHNDFKTSLPISDGWKLGFIDFIERRQRKG